MTKYIPAHTSLVPDRTWKSPTQAFADGLGETPTQTLACPVCLKESNFSIATQIVMVNGTSYCIGHAIGAEKL